MSGWTTAGGGRQALILVAVFLAVVVTGAILAARYLGGGGGHGWAVEEETVDTSIPASEAAPVREVRPGDSLLDREFLDAAVVERLPATNLPAEIARIARQPFAWRSEPFPATAWKGPDRKFARFAQKVQPGTWGWTYAVPVNAVAEAGPVRFFVGGKEIAALPLETSGEQLLPDPYFSWDPRSRLVNAVSSKRPSGVRVECAVDPLAEIGTYERRFLQSDPADDGSKPAAVRAVDLLQRVTVGAVTSTGLVVPAPGSVRIPLGALRGDELRFSVCIADQQLAMVNGCVERVSDACDGATFSVEVVADQRRKRVWTQQLSHSQVGKAPQEASVDLSAWRGRAISLRLVSEPGPRGNASFDYAIWSGLRIYGAPAKKPERPHVVLIDVDTLRADRLGCYGSERPTSPRIDAWAKRNAAVYRDVLSTASWTLPATASMFTGMLVHQHGIDEFPKALSTATPTLPAILRRNGYETFAIGEGGFVLPSLGFALGFDHFELAEMGPDKVPDWSPAMHWLESRRSEQPAFLFLHTYFVHAPYHEDLMFCAPSPKYAGRLAGKGVDSDALFTPFNAGTLELDESDREYVRRQYDARVRKMDRFVGDTLDRLERLFAGEEWVAIVTSDHGEEFFEHGRLGHGHALHQVLLRIPLIIRYPKSLASRPLGSIEAPASIVDVAPTVLALAGIDVPDYVAGRALHHDVETLPPRLHYLNTHVQGISHAEYKLIRDRSPASKRPPSFVLYEITADPAETFDLAEERPSVVEGLADLFQRWSERYPLRHEVETASDINGATMNALHELGYVGGAPADAEH